MTLELGSSRELHDESRTGRHWNRPSDATFGAIVRVPGGSKATIGKL